MSDLSIVAANVVKVSGTSNNSYSCGISITPATAAAMYLTSSNTLALCDATSATTAQCVGLTLNESVATLGGPVSLLTTGTINVGTILTQGVTYCVSPTANAGKLCPDSDITSGDYKFVVGVASSPSTIALMLGAGVAPFEHG